MNMKQLVLSLIILSVFTFQCSVMTNFTAAEVEGERSHSPSSLSASSSRLAHERGRLQRNRNVSSSTEASRSRQRSPSRCRTHSFVLDVSRPNCKSKKVSVQGCSGQCTSSVIPTVRGGPPRFTSTCRCCRPVGERVGHTLLHCHLHSRSVIRRVNIRAATDCNCRPCSSDIGV